MQATINICASVTSDMLGKEDSTHLAFTSWNGTVRARVVDKVQRLLL